MYYRTKCIGCSVIVTGQSKCRGYFINGLTKGKDKELEVNIKQGQSKTGVASHLVDPFSFFFPFFL